MIGAVHVSASAGRASYNAPWHWHFDPIDVQMVENARGLCDAEPSFVEENLKYFITIVGDYGPWTAKLVDLEVFS